MTHLHNRVVNSLLQFMYDNHSLNVFMSVGLIFSLVRFIEQQNIVLQGTSSCSRIPGDVDEAAEQEVGEKQVGPDEPGEPETLLHDDKPDVEEETFEETVEVTEPKVAEIKKPAGPVFRINSPSYQAVQYELEQFLQMRDTHGASSPRGGLPDYSPASPSSLLQSPDRSPLYLSCGYSPDRSVLSPEISGFSSPTSPRSPSPVYRFQPDFSPPSSPPLSPPEACYSPPHASFSPPHPSSYSPSHPCFFPPHPSYSPVETFSDGEEIEPSQPATTTSTASTISTFAASTSTTISTATSAVSNPCSTSTQNTEEPGPITVLDSTQGRSRQNPAVVKVTTTPAKKIKLSGPQIPVYKYSASPITSQIIQKIILPPAFQVFRT